MELTIYIHCKETGTSGWKMKWFESKEARLSVRLRITSRCSVIEPAFLPRPRLFSGRTGRTQEYSGK